MRLTEDTRRVGEWVFAAALFGLACGHGERPLRFEQPPAESYALKIFQVRIGGATAAVRGAVVAPEFFTTAKLSPELGRLFVQADFAAPTASVVIVSHQLWADRLGARPTAIGQAIEVDGHAATIVGVTPRGFDVPAEPTLWIARVGPAR